MTQYTFQADLIVIYENKQKKKALMMINKVGWDIHVCHLQLFLFFVLFVGHRNKIIFVMSMQNVIITKLNDNLQCKWFQYSKIAQ